MKSLGEVRLNVMEGSVERFVGLLLEEEKLFLVKKEVQAAKI